ncbi:MAG: DUF1501 domain-containing protein [Crocinitomicaceae bacterium]|nr:DUF1501 domain-containing protein [Crocinitomicaceae bacterium]
MDRRDFLKKSTFASGMMLIPSFLKGMEFIKPESISGFKNVIIIQLSGGNDGLNTIIPHRNDSYHNLRPTISKSLNETLKLTDDLGINKACLGLKELFDNGEMTIINNVGYPNPNRSHFRSRDIWHSGSDSSEYLKTGWAGRYLDSYCQGAYQAIEHDSSLSLILKGKKTKGIAVTNPKQLFQATRETYFKNIVKNTDQDLLNEDNQGYLYKTLLETYSSADYIYERSKIYASQTDYPGNSFGKSLKGISDMINSGLNTRVYYSTLGGFDTHVNQNATQDQLLKIYSESISALVKDLKKTGKFKDTLILTFSEFGRRAKENGSRGTDHGTANNLFIIGSQLKQPGVLGNAPDLSNLDNNGDLIYDIDFRSIYATVLNRWLDADDTIVLGKNFQKLNFI